MGWQYRREVTVPEARPSGLPGDDVAVVEMPTGGFVAADGKDVRVVAEGNREVACRALMVGPGDRLRVAFAVRPGTTRYYVYFGNAKAPERAKTLDIRRGVLQETWEYAGGHARSLAEAKATVGKCRKLLGRTFRPGLFSGFNPFGPQQRIASIVTGYFVVDKGGRHELACTARGASFLLIDDRLVCSAGGWRGPQQRIRRGTEVSLSAGLHKLTLYHICVGGDPIILVAWRPAGEQWLRLFPADLFTKVVEATPGPMQRYGSRADADFIYTQAGEAFVMNRYYQRFTFRGLAAGAGAVRDWQWDFGDGTTAAGAKVEHIFLRPGLYTVTLTASTPGGKRIRRNRISVDRPWAWVTHQGTESLRKYAHTVGRYDLSGLRTDLLAEAVVLFKRADRMDDVIRAGRALVARKSVADSDIALAVPPYVEELLKRGKAAEAAGALLKVVGMTDSAVVQAEALVRAGRVRLEYQGDPDGAMVLFGRVLKAGGRSAGGAWRTAALGAGDVWRARGDYDKARQAYGRIRVAQGSTQETALRRGDLARHVEDYLRRKEWAAAEETLDRWQKAFPLDKLEGYWSLLRARLLAARKRHGPAAREAEAVVKANPKSNYAAALLAVAARAYEAAGNSQQVRTTLKRIVDGYPESSLAAEAAEKLKGL